jgi:hypothetical protein
MNCSNCGAPIDIESFKHGECEYCKTSLQNDIQPPQSREVVYATSFYTTNTRDVVIPEGNENASRLDEPRPAVVAAKEKREKVFEKKKKAKKWWLIVLPFLGFAIWFAFDYANRRTIAIIFGICVVIVIIVLITGEEMRCPVCKKRWARSFKGKQEVGRQGGYRTVTRYDVRRNSKGEEIGRTEREEQVHVIQITYQNNYQCKYCQYSWTTLSTTEYEG